MLYSFKPLIQRVPLDSFFSAVFDKRHQKGKSMTLNFKTTYLRVIRGRYFRASKAKKSLILDELCEVTGYNRKWAIRVLAKSHKTGPKFSERKKQYFEQALYHLNRLWHILGRINSKKMVAAFPVWLDFYDRQDFQKNWILTNFYLELKFIF